MQSSHSPQKTRLPCPLASLEIITYEEVPWYPAATPSSRPELSTSPHFKSSPPQGSNVTCAALILHYHHHLSLNPRLEWICVTTAPLLAYSVILRIYVAGAFRSETFLRCISHLEVPHDIFLTKLAHRCAPSLPLRDLTLTEIQEHFGCFFAPTGFWCCAWISRSQLLVRLEGPTIAHGVGGISTKKHFETFGPLLPCQILHCARYRILAHTSISAPPRRLCVPVGTPLSHL